MIEGIATNDLDFLSCKADVGYPLRRSITILTDITGDFTEFTEVEPFKDPIVDYEKCSIEKTIKYRRIKFNMTWDGTRVLRFTIFLYTLKFGKPFVLNGPLKKTTD